MGTLAKWLWWPFDIQGEWIRRIFDPQGQIRLGVVMTDLGLILCFSVVKTSEPPLIFEMSALALLFGGIGVVVTAVLAKVTEETSDDVQACEQCGHDPNQGASP
jgi:hypothetical protein